MGVIDLTERGVKFWELCKQSYALRSKIVHSYSFPEEDEIIMARDFAEKQLIKLINYAFDKISNGNISKDTFVHELKSKALDG